MSPLADVIHAAVLEILAEPETRALVEQNLVSRIAELEARMADLEARPPVIGFIDLVDPLAGTFLEAALAEHKRLTSPQVEAQPTGT